MEKTLRSRKKIFFKIDDRFTHTRLSLPILRHLIFIQQLYFGDTICLDRNKLIGAQ